MQFPEIKIKIPKKIFATSLSNFLPPQLKFSGKTSKRVNKQAGFARRKFGPYLLLLLLRPKMYVLLLHTPFPNQMIRVYPHLI